MTNINQYWTVSGGFCKCCYLNSKLFHSDSMAYAETVTSEMTNSMREI